MTMTRKKRFTRFLAWAPRARNEFRWQRRQDEVKVKCDSDFAACVRTGRSTTCCVGMLGQHMLNSLSVTQPNPPALSTGEAEFNAEIRACVEVIYLKNLLNFFGHTTKAIVETDSSAAKGIIGRLGASKKTKHFAVKKFWVQSLVREKVIQVRKIAGTENEADLGTKAVDGPTLNKLLPKVGIVLLTAAGLPLLGESRRIKSMVNMLNMIVMATHTNAEELDLQGPNKMLTVFRKVQKQAKHTLDTNEITMLKMLM